MGRAQQHGGQRRPDMAKTDTQSLPAASSTATSPSVRTASRDGYRSARIGAADAEEIGGDQPAERGQPAQVSGDGGLVPQQVDRERGGGYEEQIGSVAPDVPVGGWTSPSRAYTVSGIPAMARACHPVPGVPTRWTTSKPLRKPALTLVAGSGWNHCRR